MRLARGCARCHEEAANEPEGHGRDVAIASTSETLIGALELVSCGIFWRISRDTAGMRWQDYCEGSTEKEQLRK